jgi:hypothetical protein
MTIEKDAGRPRASNAGTLASPEALAVPLGDWLYDRFEIWQMRLLRADELGSFARDRGLPFGIFDDVSLLWRAGLLHADIVVAKRQLSRKGFRRLGQRHGSWWYADERVWPRRKDGWRNLASSSPAIPAGVTLLFHPFRYYVLWHLAGALGYQVASIQPLLNAAATASLLEQVLASVFRWSGREQAAQSLNRWDGLARLAIALEPGFLPDVTHTLRWPGHSSEEEQRKRIDKHRRDLRRTCRRIGEAELDGARLTLCEAGQRIDPNVELQTLIRLSASDFRDRIRGHVGGALLVRTMAELIRFACEDIWQKQLTEEDEVGRGPLTSELKEELYGGKRVVGESSHEEAFIRSIRLHRGTCVRLYTEGQTESSAFETAIQHLGLRNVEV